MHWLERHWYRTSALHLLLTPLSWLFGAAATLRRALYRAGLLEAVRLPVPVVIVGNLSVGGSGKTPLTLHLARQLLDNGWHPGIVSRGYGGKAEGVREVSADSDAGQVGDEPLLMARRDLCPVWIGRDRPAAAQALLAAHPECDVILCDDGLQHYRLARDVEIVVVDGVRRFGNGRLLPAGPLREPASRHADAIVTNGGQPHPGELAMTLQASGFQNLPNPLQVRQAADFTGQMLHAVAGIGFPGRFFKLLLELGLKAELHPFPDHHRFTPADLDHPDADAILMTEKDAVKCAPFADERCWALRVDAQVDPALTTLILKKITP